MYEIQHVSSTLSQWLAGSCLGRSPLTCFFQCFVTCPKVTCQQDWLLLATVFSLLRCIVNPTDFHHVCVHIGRFQPLDVRVFLKLRDPIFHECEQIPQRLTSNFQMVACRPGSEPTWPQRSWWLTWWIIYPWFNSIRAAAVCDSFALMKEIIKSKPMGLQRCKYFNRK